ncbi:hypothetical protein ACTFIZ_008691 [Dictyostelium cf. discoideum]
MSRHRFLKNMDGDDFEDFKEEDDLGEYDDEVYDVYDVVAEEFPDITYPEIEEVLMDFDYNVDDAIDFILDGGLNNKGKKKNNKKPPQAVNIINNNNNNNKKSEPVNTNKSTSKGQRRPKKSENINNNNNNNNSDDDDNNNNKNNNNKNNKNNGYKPSSLAQDLSTITNTISNIKIINDKEFSFQSLYKNNKDSDGTIIPFDFKTPSPDDIILNKQKQAFKPKHNSTDNDDTNDKDKNNIKINKK